MEVAEPGDGRSAARRPIEIYTLGRFAVHVDGVPLAGGPKGPRKPFAVLKALVATGGQGVPADPLIDALWPDSDGDHARRAFRTALHRLRALLGREAVLLSDGRLTLNAAHCWVDTQAWQECSDALRAAVTAGDAQGGLDAAESLLALYRGPFLAGESDPVAIQAARDRIHEAVLRRLSDLAALLVAQGRTTEAVALYERGLEIDASAEPFYQGLMRGYREQGRIAEALRAYERLRLAVQRRGAAGISPASEALHRALQEARSEGPADTAAALEALRRTAMLPLPSEPSLAVLPFVDLSADPAQAIVAQAVSETIITDLSRLQHLFVIDEHTMRTFTEPAANPLQVARELGVRHILQGSVQSDAGRLRIAVRLTDAASGVQVWAERYDRPREHLLAVQDEIALRVITEMEVQLTEGEQARSRERHTHNLDAYILNVRSLPLFRCLRREENLRARELSEQALELDPDYPDAVAQLGWTYWAEARYGWSDSADAAIAQAETLARRAMALDPAPGKGALVLGYAHLQRRQHDTAVAQLRSVVQAAPNRSDARAMVGGALLKSDRPEEAIPHIKHAMRLSPVYPAWHAGILGEACRLTGRHQEALAAFRHVLAREPDDVVVARPRLAVLLADLGRLDEARAVAQAILAIEPHFCLQRYGASRLYRDPAITAHMLERLRRAGLPD